MDEQKLSSEQLKDRAMRFYERYGKELEQIKDLLHIRLSQLALSYTIENNLPPEAILISTRVKSLKSFLKKLEKKKWPQFYYSTQVIQDLIGARIVCWFIDDCEGIKNLIASTNHLNIVGNIENYIQFPKLSGYRSIHLLAQVTYDRVKRNEGKMSVIPGKMTCEIQIRTKLQDAWGDITHEFHYKAKKAGIDNKEYEKMLSDIADRLATDDLSLLALRDTYQEVADEKLKTSVREGFRHK